jgi:RNA polymerase sigma-70 factor (ECF subfamily)
MMQPEVTRWLQQMQEGDTSARDSVMALLYTELHRIARIHLGRERPEHTLQPTALVNEAYLKVFAGHAPDFAHRTHFLATMSLAMRRILVDHARSRNGLRRGGQHINIGLTSQVGTTDVDAVELIALDEALDALAVKKEAAARFVEMHYFGGMTAEEIAEATGVSVHMVRQRLRFAQAWLRQKMDAPQP